ncbi:NADPH-dependent FMN reductase [Haloarcula salinisoli]|uniref:NAD(P)H-dependent oxidoreductase n=1 Tax=Haloarcula salinisoli TaxID=2487746 RepID=A0A8J8C8H9_9EURY|nr:NADPH-dependent FMN reductase [Halomicroarcula salinisoli]MBX0287059.1 NAD(P)H-dependent oxidoreductase [Halomicroarcula salinisoli]MBX0304362.1 NAD(P)H-dependent oxidoreductase [Halomicroarcula salinisoli]
MSPKQSRPLVVGVVGSLNDGSVTRRATGCALAAAAERGAETELLDLREYDLPTFDPNAEPPADVAKLTDRIEAADAVILGTPMYHGSYSSVLKTALDYCGFEEFEDTTVGLLAVAGGGFPLPALSHLREVCRAFEAWVLPTQAAVTDSHSVGDELPESDRERLADLGEGAVEHAAVGERPPAGACAVPADD